MSKFHSQGKKRCSLFFIKRDNKSSCGILNILTSFKHSSFWLFLVKSEREFRSYIFPSFLLSIWNWTESRFEIWRVLGIAYHARPTGHYWLMNPVGVEGKYIAESQVFITQSDAQGNRWPRFLSFLIRPATIIHESNEKNHKKPE